MRKEDQAFRSTEAETARGFEKDKALQEQGHSDKQLKAKLGADAENTKITAGAKGEAGGDSSAIKMAKYLREQNYDPAIADGVAAGAIEIIKDEKSGELTAINSLTGKKIGGLEKAPGASRRDPKVWMSEKDKEQSTGQQFNFAEDMAKKSMEGGLINSVKGEASPVKPSTGIERAKADPETAIQHLLSKGRAKDRADAIAKWEQATGMKYQVK